MDLIHFLQQFDQPAIRAAMVGFTFLGNAEFYLLVFPIAFWCWRKEDGPQLAILLLLNTALIYFLKETLQHPRPPEEYRMLPTGADFGFPSGHAQGAMVLFGYYGWKLKSYFIPGTLIFLIGFSRVYLGVHFMSQVVSGWVIGMILLVFWTQIIKSNRVKNLNPKYYVKIVTILLLATIIPVLLPYRIIFLASAFYGMIAVGFTIENKWVGFIEKSVWWKQIVKVVIGIGGVIGLMTFMESILPGTDIGLWIKGAVVGLWVSLIAPFAFKFILN